MTDRLDELWASQAQQQQLWYDLDALPPEDRNHRLLELFGNLVEEVVEMQQAMVSRYHLLKRDEEASPADVAGRGASVLKLLVAVMQLGGVGDPGLLVEQFIAKTIATEAKWRWQMDSLADTEVLLCDIDGCVALWQPSFREYLGIRGIHATASQLNDPEMEPHKTAFREAGGFRALAVVNEGIQILNSWRRAKPKSRRLIMVTARPYKRHHRVYMDTVEWCRAAGLACDHILFEPDKAEAVRQVKPARVVAHIEDRGRHALEVAHTGVIVLKLPHEAAGHDEVVHHPNIVHVHSWDEIQAYLETHDAQDR